jgi:hypothetical protein
MASISHKPSPLKQQLNISWYIVWEMIKTWNMNKLVHCVGDDKDLEHDEVKACSSPRTGLNELIPDRCPPHSLGKTKQ